MIAHLKGKVVHNGVKYLVLDVAGVGYKVFATFETIGSGPSGVERSLWIYHAIREDASDLYGFATKDELDFFELLISISGIGPRTALGILNVTTVSALKRAISSGETAHLVKVSGVGKKIADKIVLELKDKVGAKSEGIGLKEEVDALDALKSLGFSHSDAREALKGATDAASTNERIKRALKILGR
ncbi:MAG TPA: Holliday junction branch migration protein RuvA [Candidatus Paceibacterota bacterium]